MTKSSNKIILGTTRPVKQVSCEQHRKSNGSSASTNEYDQLPLTDFEKSMNQLYTNEDDSVLTSIIDQLETNYKSEREVIYQSGYNAGLEAGRQEHQQKAGSQLSDVESILQSLKEDQWRLRKEAELSVLNLAIKIAQRVIRSEIEIDRSKLMNVIHEALDYVQRDELIKIRLNPKDYAYLSGESTMLDELPPDVQIESDNSLTPGGCVLQTNLEMVDASVERKLEELTTQLYTNLSESDENV